MARPDTQRPVKKSPLYTPKAAAVTTKATTIRDTDGAYRAEPKEPQ